MLRQSRCLRQRERGHAQQAIEPSCAPFPRRPLSCASPQLQLCTQSCSNHMIRLTQPCHRGELVQGAGGAVGGACCRVGSWGAATTTSGQEQQQASAIGSDRVVLDLSCAQLIDCRRRHQRALLTTGGTRRRGPMCGTCPPHNPHMCCCRHSIPCLRGGERGAEAGKRRRAGHSVCALQLCAAPPGQAGSPRCQPGAPLAHEVLT